MTRPKIVRLAAPCTPEALVARRRKAAAEAKAEARRVAQLAQLKEDLRALLADVILSEPLELDPGGNVVPLFRRGGPARRPVPDDTGDAA